MSQRTRDEHLAFCKERALKYVERGDLMQAVTSMASDMSKHPELGVSDLLLHKAYFFDVPNGPHAVRRWIDGFN